MAQGSGGRPKRLEKLDLESMRSMLKGDPSLLEARDEYEDSPLLRAASEGRVKQCEHLIELGADVHGTDNRGQTPLHRAAEYGSVATCELLVAAGASFFAESKFGLFPYDSAFQCTSNSRKSILEWFDRRPERTIRQVVRSGDVEELRAYLSDHVEILKTRHASDMLTTMLRQAIDDEMKWRISGRNGDLAALMERWCKMCDFILSLGLDVNVNSLSEPPMYVAAQVRWPYFARRLLEHGAAIDVLGESMIELARWSQNEEVVALLDAHCDRSAKPG